ncbi:MAG: galactokinase [Ginsengibacter sp.]
MIDNIRRKFVSLYKEEPIIVRSPGRINLIGEHTDYNNGFVLPAAIDKAIYVAVTARTDEEIYMFAVDENDDYQGNIKQLMKSGKQWPDFILGSLQQLQIHNYHTAGFNLVVGGDVPLGAGLSSSAALECASLFAFKQIFKLDISLLDIVKMAQRAENDFVGVQCGIMDQFASGFGKKNHVIKLDCRSLEYEYKPFMPDDVEIILLNTNVKHSLADTEYNTRRKQCEKGVALIKKKYAEVESLRDATLEMVEELIKPVDEIVYRRCVFMVTEIKRVPDACADLDNKDIAAFGKKMFEAHEGLSKDYEVSCKELDFLVDHVRQFPAVIGARMMGGGFGGCTINLVKKEAIDRIINDINIDYKNAMGLELTMYRVSIENGTGLIN